MSTNTAEALATDSTSPTDEVQTAATATNVMIAAAPAHEQGADTDKSVDKSTAAPRERRAAPTNAQMDSFAKKAKEDFARQYQGALVSLDTEFRNHVVVRAYNRIWGPVQRNWLTSMTILRTAVGDSAAAVKVEVDLLAIMTKINSVYGEQHARLDHLLAGNGDSQLAMKNIAYQNPKRDRLKILGPVAFKLRNVLMAADSLMDKSTVAYTLEEIDSDAHEKIKFMVKKTLKNIDSLARNSRNLALQRSRDAGLTRPGYKAANDDMSTEGELLQTA